MGRSAKKVNNFEPLKISAKHSILDVLNTPLSSSQQTHDVVSTSIRTRTTSYDILSKLKRRCVYGDALSLPAISSCVLEYSKSTLKENCQTKGKHKISSKTVYVPLQTCCEKTAGKINGFIDFFCQKFHNRKKNVTKIFLPFSTLIIFFLNWQSTNKLIC